MKKKQLQKIISGRLRKINGYCKNIRKNFDDASIHQFRVEVKKLRALLRLVALELKHPQKLKLPNKLKTVYAVAGEIRDTQLHLKRIAAAIEKKDGQPDAYNKLLQQKINKKKKQLAKLLSRRFFPAVKRKIVSRLPAALNPETAIQFVQQKMTSLTVSITAEPDDEALHTIRKHLKDLMYDVNPPEDDIKNALPPDLVSKEQLQSVKHLTDQLGEFNDLCYAVQSVDPGRMKVLKDEEKEQLNRIRNQWIKEKEQLKKTALSSLSAFYSGAATAKADDIKLSNLSA